MAKYEVSPTLINQLQISLRKEAGLPSFNPSDHSLPSPSILQDAIAVVGSSADALRCTDCKGELLRGSQSIICIYCGSFQRSFRDFPPVSFKSTLGFQWFLRSLSLDGSESVERPIDGATESGRGQSSVKDEIPLSELLDLQLKWPDESNRFDVENEHGKRLSRFVGVDFDELFRTEENSEHASSSLNKQLVANENHNTEDAATVSGQSSGLFESQMRSGEGDNDQESDWAAEFQSADSDVEVDYGSHLKLKSGSLEKKDLENISISHLLSTSDNEPSSKQPVDSNQSERSSLFKDDDKGFVPVGDTSFGWLPATDKQRTSNKGDPLVDDWDEFRVFTGAEKNQGEPINPALPDTNSSGGLDVSDSWNDFTGSVEAEQTQLQNNLDVMKSGYSGGNDDLWGHTGMGKQDVSVESTHNAASDQADSLALWNGTSKEVDDSYDLWNDFKTSALRHDNQAQSIAIEAAGDKWAAEGDGILKAQLDFAGLSNRNKEQQSDSSESIVVKNNDSHGDSLALWNHDSRDVWSDFARSNGASDSKKVSSDPFGAWSDVSGLMVTHVNQPQSSDTISAENETVVKDDSAFGSWSDFTTAQSQVEDIFSDTIIPEKDSKNLTSSAEDKNKRNSWSDFGWSTSISEQQLHDGGRETFGNQLTSADLFGFHSGEKDSFSFPDNQAKTAAATFRDGDLAGGNDEPDAWTDFTSSRYRQTSSSLGTNANAAFDQQANKHGPFDAWDVIGSASNRPAGKATAVEKGDGDLASGNEEPIDAWTDFTSSSNGQASSSLGTNANAAFDQQAVKLDPFDAWDVIGSASNIPVGSATTVKKGNIPEFDLLNTGISQFAGTNSSSHPDQFQQMLNDQNGSIQVAISQTEAPDLVRTNPDGKADDSDQLSRSDRVVEESSDLKSPVVENLISEMHGLSFMLESSLSIPKSST